MTDSSMDWPNRWNHLQKILNRPGNFSHDDFTPGPEVFEFLSNTCKVLVVGAGGLGCELLKNLALMGFRNLEVIDMDYIELSNLNRQFLFRQEDVGKSKAEVAANFINKRIPGCRVVPHCRRIQDMTASFYKEFYIVVCGLDSVVARRWMNGMLVSLTSEDGMNDGSMVPMVDGGTEGFKGNVRVIAPRESACVECTLDLYPPQIKFPLCTIAHTPRLPEHCIEYVKVLLWPKERGDERLDGDDPEHIKWIFEKASEKAQETNIKGVTYRLTQGVVKNIIPAVASTNAVIAAACATEVFKLATSAYPCLNNYMVFNDLDGIYTYTFKAEKKENCAVCSQVPKHIRFDENDKLQDVIDHLINNSEYQMRSPGITTTVDMKNRTLYMQNVKSIEVATRPHLKMTLKELGLVSGQEIVVADVTSPSSMIFQLELTSKIECD